MRKSGCYEEEYVLQQEREDVSFLEENRGRGREGEL